MDSKYEPDQYIPTIDAILSVADSNQITVKRIRNALQELFSVNLEPHKKNINSIILERYYKRDEQREKDKEMAEKRAEMMAQDAIMAARLLKTYSNSPITRSGGKVTKKKAGAKGASGPKTINRNNPFNREMVLSNELAAVIGVNKASRPQVVKLLWAYIKERSLQNESDKRQILCDSPLQNVFKKRAFEMNKILSNHIFKEEDISAEEGSKSGKKLKVNGNASKKEVKYNSEVDDDDDDEEDVDVYDLESTRDTTPVVKQEQRKREPLYSSELEEE